jgi:hypothetical protein
LVVKNKNANNQTNKKKHTRNTNYGTYKTSPSVNPIIKTDYLIPKANCAYPENSTITTSNFLFSNQKSIIQLKIEVKNLLHCLSANFN